MHGRQRVHLHRRPLQTPCGTRAQSMPLWLVNRSVAGAARRRTNKSSSPAGLLALFQPRYAGNRGKDEDVGQGANQKRVFENAARSNHGALRLGRGRTGHGRKQNKDNKRQIPSLLKFKPKQIPAETHRGPAKDMLSRIFAAMAQSLPLYVFYPNAR